MPQVLQRPQAEADLDDIWWHIAQDNYSPNGFIGAARQALTKLGVPWEPTEAERAYNEGRSTQVPVNAVVRVKSRFSRRLGYHGYTLVVERKTSRT
jgi:hypothetical protein